MRVKNASHEMEVRVELEIIFSIPKYFARFNSSGDKKANLIIRIMEANNMHYFSTFF